MYSKRVALKEIAENNDHNLNISRYVSNGQKEAGSTWRATHAQLVEIENRIGAATTKLDFCHF